jgi:hypothetical protein
MAKKMHESSGKRKQGVAGGLPDFAGFCSNLTKLLITGLKDGAIYGRFKEWCHLET